MRRWESLTALGGVVCAAFGATRLPYHQICTYMAIALLAIVAISRLIFALRTREGRSDAAERAQRIREQRKRR